MTTPDSLSLVVTLLIGAQLMSYIFVYFVVARVLGSKNAMEELGFTKKD